MQVGKFVCVIVSVFMFLAGALLARAANSEEAGLYSFCKTYSNYCADGDSPNAQVAIDREGNLYSTTYAGTDNDCLGSGCGGVFELQPLAKGKWGQKVLHSFPANAIDGALPNGVILDAAGDLYGTTNGGGLAGPLCNPFGCGTLFELTPGSGGEWTESILYSFCSASGCEDGAGPAGNLILDAAGNLYGSTADGGSTTNEHCRRTGCGIVFEIEKQSDGTWTEKVLHRFSFVDGGIPFGSLVFDAKGNLYGTTNAGGAYELGTVFELTHNANGSWTESVLYSFNTTDGRSPLAGLIFDDAGNLYGTTYEGGTGAACVYTYGCGTVFELSPGPNGSWTEQVLYNFCGTDTGICQDGANPWGSLILERSGSLLGTTYIGGTYGTSGTIFRLTRRNGTWSESVVHNFGVEVNDGANPQTGLTVDSSTGIFYGTTAGGGDSTNCNGGQGCGTVYAFSLGSGGAVSKWWVDPTE
jgi:uncharacterized repeat protein (TIGR03803 family)